VAEAMHRVSMCPEVFKLCRTRVCELECARQVLAQRLDARMCSRFQSVLGTTLAQVLHNSVTDVKAECLLQRGAHANGRDKSERWRQRRENGGSARKTQQSKRMEFPKASGDGTPSLSDMSPGA